MKRGSQFLIKLIAYIALGVGVYCFAKQLESFFNFIFHIKFYYKAGVSIILSAGIVYLIPVFRVIAAMKVVQRHDSGRRLMVYSSAVFSALVIIGAWVKTIYFLYDPSLQYAIPEGSIADFLSYVQSDMIAVFDLIVLFIFTRPEIKNEFK